MPNSVQRPTPAPSGLEKSTPCFCAVIAHHKSLASLLAQPHRDGMPAKKSQERACVHREPLCPSGERTAAL
eukprot:5642092-Pyramimonas_sp.AAC.1